MNNFTFYSPTCFVFGKDRESEAGALVHRFGGTKVLVHYGGGSVVRSGLLDRVKKSLEEEDIPEMVRVLCRGGGRGGSISGFVTLNEEDCEKIYRMMV